MGRWSVNHMTVHGIESAAAVPHLVPFECIVRREPRSAMHHFIGRFVAIAAATLAVIHAAAATPAAAAPAAGPTPAATSTAVAATPAAPPAGSATHAATTTTAVPPAAYTYVHHPVSTDIPAAQFAFDRGLTMLFAYQPDEAEQAFRQAARLDPPLLWRGGA